MKTMAIEFTLTRETWIRDFARPSLLEVAGEPTELRCRVVFDDVACLRVYCREDSLGEPSWRSVGDGPGDDPPPRLEGIFVDRDRIIGLALRGLAFGTSHRSMRELPNGAIVFDLGTV